MDGESDTAHLTTAEVAARLGVKPATVYAYVSRGLLTKVATSDRRASLFSAAEVARLARRQRAGAPAAVEGTASAISRHDGDRLFYRDHDVADLVPGHSVESVASLLWTGQLAPPSQPLVTADQILTPVTAAVESLGGRARLTDRMRVAVPVAAALDPLRFDLTPAGVQRAARTLLSVEVDSVSPVPGTPGTLAERLWPALTDRPARPELLDAVLVLLADHGLAISTVAARVAASARVHPYGVVSAGLGALDSQFHGTASTLAHRFLAEARTEPIAAVSERLRLGTGIPGFGHLVYRTVDPRARIVLDLLAPVAEARPVLETIRAITDHLDTTVTDVLNIDLALAALMHAFDMRADAGEAIFAVARTIGWIAHTLEEYREPPMRFRPTSTRVRSGEVARGHPT